MLAKRHALYGQLYTFPSYFFLTGVANFPPEENVIQEIAIPVGDSEKYAFHTFPTSDVDFFNAFSFHSGPEHWRQGIRYVSRIINEEPSTYMYFHTCHSFNFVQHVVLEVRERGCYWHINDTNSRKS